MTPRNPLSLANDLIDLGHRAIDERRPSQHYFYLAERLTDAAEAGTDIAPIVADAVALLSGGESTDELRRRLPTTEPLPSSEEPWTSLDSARKRHLVAWGEQTVKRINALPQGPSSEDIASACRQIEAELSSPEFAAAVERCDELLRAEDERRLVAALALVPPGTTVRHPERHNTGLVLRHAPLVDGSVYVRWGAGAGVRLSWEDPAKLTPLSRPLTIDEQARRDAHSEQA